MEIYIAGESGDTVILVCEIVPQGAAFLVDTPEGKDYLSTKDAERQSGSIADQ